MEDRFRFRIYSTITKDFTYDDSEFLLPTGEIGYFTGSYPHYRKFKKQEDFIIEQCTGYRDCNGKPIFVGDICSIKGRYRDDKESEWLGTEWIDVDTVEAVYSLESFFGESMIKGVYTALGCDTLKVEVIGNFHQNPELVEG